MRIQTNPIQINPNQSKSIQINPNQSNPIQSNHFIFLNLLWIF